MPVDPSNQQILGVLPLLRLLERLQGASVEDARAVTDDDVIALLGVPLSPRRMTCGTLVVQAVGAAGFQAG